MAVTTKGAPVRQHDLHSARPRRGLRALWTAAVLGAVAVLTGCQGEFSDGYLLKGVTQESQQITTLWVWAWIALFGVGFLVWGLIFWVMIRYRAKPGDNSIPPQLRYNVPIEVLYTIVPIFMIITFFYYTAKVESDVMGVGKQPDVRVNVYGKQWSWDFNYLDADVHEVGTQAVLTGEPGVEQTLPTLYIPVGKRVEFIVTSRDVAHSFWVPAFLQKLDMIPGRVNRFQVVPTETGTFAGKCAELCGAYHSRMLFNVKIVEQAEFDQHMADLKAAGQTGILGDEFSREKLMKGEDLETSGGLK